MVSSELAAAASTNFDPESTIRWSGLAVPRNIVPASPTTVDSSAPSTDWTSEFIWVSRTSSLVGRLDSSPAMTSPALAYGGLLSGGSKSRYCSPTAERLCTCIFESSGILVPSSSASRTRSPLGVTSIAETLPTLTPR